MTIQSTQTGNVGLNHRFNNYERNQFDLENRLFHLPSAFPPFNSDFSLFNTVYHGTLLYLLVTTIRIYIYIDS